MMSELMKLERNKAQATRDWEYAFHVTVDSDLERYCMAAVKHINRQIKELR